MPEHGTERLAFVLHDMFGDFDALLTLLDPDVVVRIDLGARPADGLREVRGAAHAVGLAASYRRSSPFAHAALVSGSAGIVTADDRQPASVMAFTFAAGKITEIYILADRSRLTRLGLAPPDNSTGRDPVIFRPPRRSAPR